MATKKTEVAEKKTTDLAVKNIPMKNILKESVGVIMTFASKEETEKKLKKLAKDKAKRISELIAIPELSKKELEEAKAIRAELRDPRYELQNVEKHNTSVLNNSKTANKLMIGEFIALIEPTESIIHNKIVAEENKIELAKQAEKEAKEKKEQEIQDKINNAVAFFEDQLEKAREDGNWEEYDKYYNDFEANIEELEEMEFEGTEVLEKYKKRKEEIIELVEKAKEQAERDKEQNKKAEELQEKEEKLIESKRRMKAFFEIGFMFNGEAFTNGESIYNEEDIEAKTPEDFDKIIKHWTDLKEEEENKILEQTERTKKYNELVIEGIELKVFNSEYIQVAETEKVTDEQIFVLSKKIEEAKTEAGKKAKEEKEAEDAKKAKELKEAGKLICDSVNEGINKIITDYANLKIDNLDALNAFNRFTQLIDIEFVNLKKRLNQTDESI